MLEIKNKDIAAYLKLPPVKLHCSMLAEDAIKVRAHRVGVPWIGTWWCAKGGACRGIANSQMKVGDPSQGQKGGSEPHLSLRKCGFPLLFLSLFLFMKAAVKDFKDKQTEAGKAQAV